ncbi:MAG: 30S ribosomal protein S20 [Firmicutes bacterium]|nr:30S ribosomal protein S20 [Bacillota bacterium]
MANIKSAQKRIKTAKIRNMRNNIIKTGIKTAIKKFEKAIAEGNIETAEKTLINAVKTLDKAVSKGVIHKNTAARKKSKLYGKFNNLKNAS